MVMRGVLAIVILSLLGVGGRADTLTLSDGQAIKGKLAGFAGRKFEFNAADGSVYSGYPVDIKSIVPDAPVKVSLKFALKQYDPAEFIQYDHNTMRLKKNGQLLNEPVFMLMSMRLPSSGLEKSPERVSGETDTVDVAPPEVDQEAEQKPREWQRSGKWREVETDQSTVISRGEEVDVESALKKGVVNIVQFHYPRSLASVREGNYIEALARRSNQVVVLKVLVPDFRAPICTALGIKGLPQFWVYNPQGKLVAKLTDRFTEGDIDQAIKEARRSR